MTVDRAVPVTGVSEITLEQNDLAAAEEFYSGVLGFPVVERWADTVDAKRA
jgi:catechol 2,3-dioxygenase-like lactoylglutathione lyase family enzyme